uniref:Uncharacterized protein n=1 Tax=Arundo donax TaxID=35708 RepID=A0A0A9HBD3_ARUDO
MRPPVRTFTQHFVSNMVIFYVQMVKELPVREYVPEQS